MGRSRYLAAAVAVAVLWGADLRSQPAADLLLVGGLVYDGSGEAPHRQDVGVTGERISFVGDAAAAGLDAPVVVDVDGLLVTPGFIDMHSHAELAEEHGRGALPFLHQGITTVAIGVDGAGTPDVAERFAGLAGRIGVNTFAYVGHGGIRRRVIGEVDRAPTASELDEMRALVAQAMREGAFGLSTGLLYVPGYYATTEEVRFRDPETVRRLDVETLEMLAIRGGADKLLFADPRPELNGRTLAAVAAEWELPVPATVRRILTAGNAAVMNLDPYDIENTRHVRPSATVFG